MRLQNLIVLSLLCAASLLPGCAARDSLKSTSANEHADAASLSFSDQIAALPEGAMHYVAEGSFGPATVEAGAFYTSGLGHECRSIRITRGSESRKFALCHENGGPWGFIPTIFESLPQ